MATATGRDTGSAKSRKRASDDSDSFPKRPKLEAKTDLTRWRVKDDDSRHTWHYLADDKAAAEWPQSYAEKWFLNLPTGLPTLPKAETPLEAAKNGLTFFEKLQMPSGHWACEYGGPMFLLSGVVIAWYVTKTPISDAYATEIKNYLTARAHPEDGGWGLHIEGESTVFGTAMNYVVMRIVGVDPEDPVMVKARGTLHKLGGALNSPHWAKFWLAVLGVVDWDIVNPVPPEIWLLPDWVPIAPWRWWIHIRQVFLPMGYLYSKRWSCEETDITRALKQELFVQPHAEIVWASHRNDISAIDNYHPKSWLLNTINWVLVNVYNPYLRFNFLKERGEKWVSELVDMEDANTEYSCLAPVNAPMNTLVCYIRDGPDAYSTKRHIERLEEYLWVKDEGLLCNGTNGVQCWDTSFAILSVVESGLHTDERWKPMLLKGLEYLDRHQIRENCKDQEKCYRQPRKGAWPFSNRDQGYGVSDCTSEALKAVILLQKTEGYPQLVDDQRIFDSVDTLLLYQNDNGAVSSYEARRGDELLELLNAAEVFGRIMIEYDYPECTTACVQALSLFHKHWPDYRTKDVKLFIRRATNWIRTNQKYDGSWYGSWGICFTYASMFALQSMKAVGETYSNSQISRAGCDFLISKQREDGGWSESYRACETMKYSEHESGSLVVQTAWALIGLLVAEYPDVEPIKKGIRLIASRQQENGEWLQEAIEGVFNKSCMISYPNYKFTFTIKALGMFAKRYPDEKLYSTMSYVTMAQQGLAAVDASNWEEALNKLSFALKESLSPVWLIARSKALAGLKRPQEALDDADLAWHMAIERNKRELMATAQYRRGVAFFQLKQYANADYCFMHCMRIIKGGPAVPKEDPGLELVDEKGFWTVTAAEALTAARYDDIGKKDSTLQGENPLAAAAANRPHFKEWRMASNMRIQALSAMEKLPTEDNARKLTTTMVPEKKGLADHQSSKVGAETAKVEAAKAQTAKSVEVTKADVKAETPAVPKDTPLRLQDFQSNTQMSVSIFSKGVNKEKLLVQFLESSVRLDPVVYPNGDEREFELDLWGEIIPAKSHYTVTPNKVELSLAKKTPGKWTTLKSDGSAKRAPVSTPQVVETSSEKAPATAPAAAPAPAATPAYPTSSRSGPKNWDQFGADENSDDEKDVNLFFKKLYKGATPEQQRAMMKSFTESNGTSLSTNWDDVKGKKVETVPPEGVEAKKWS
ncbi:oxidosqualene:lanosterol cyclase [Trichoderma afarasin]